MGQCSRFLLPLQFLAEPGDFAGLVHSGDELPVTRSDDGVGFFIGRARQANRFDGFSQDCDVAQILAVTRCNFDLAQFYLPDGSLTHSR